MNVLGQLVHTVERVALLPLFLSAWSVGLYGEWLVLLALPTYFSAVADAGLTRVSANDMTIKFAQQRNDEIIQVFQSAWVFVSSLSLLIVGVILLVTIQVGVTHLLGLKNLSNYEALQILFCALLMLLIGFQTNTVQAALRAIGHYADGALSTHIFSLLEFIVVASALFMGARPFVVAILIVAIRIIELVVATFILRHFAPWLHHGIVHANIREIRRLLVPSLAVLGLPSGDAAIVEGFIIILNHTIGPLAVVLFSTTRTMTRFTPQSVTMFSAASWPEISRLYGAGRSDRLGAFLTHGTQLAAIIVIVFAAIFIGGAPFIFKIWTVGRVEGDRLLVTVFMVAAAAMSFRSFPSVLIVATNRHIGYSGWYALICFLALGACYPISVAFGVNGAAFDIATAEIATLAVGMAYALTQIGEGSKPIKRIFTTLPPVRQLFARNAG